MRSILVNPIYAGDMVWNRRTDACFHMITQGRGVERLDLTRRLEELERLAAEEHDVQESAHEIDRFISGLEWSLQHGVGEERSVCCGQSCDRVIVEKTANRATVHIPPLPSRACGGGDDPVGRE